MYRLRKPRREGRRLTPPGTMSLSPGASRPYTPKSRAGPRLATWQRYGRSRGTGSQLLPLIRPCPCP